MDIDLEVLKYENDSEITLYLSSKLNTLTL